MCNDWCGLKCDDPCNKAVVEAKLTKMICAEKQTNLMIHAKINGIMTADDEHIIHAFMDALILAIIYAMIHAMPRESSMRESLRRLI